MACRRARPQPAGHILTISLGRMQLQPSPSHHDVAKGADRTTQVHQAASFRQRVTTNTDAVCAFGPSATDQVARPPLMPDRHQAQNVSAPQLSRRLCEVGYASLRSTRMRRAPICKLADPHLGQLSDHALSKICSRDKSRPECGSADLLDLNGDNLAAQRGGF
jgi:hypothetical protein